MQRRIKRDFRQMKAPARFLAFCLRVRHALTEITNFPESLAHLLQLYLALVDRLQTVYHVSLDGSHSVIREREKISQEIVVLLEQIASGLEAAFILNTDALLTTGFTVTVERRITNREKIPLAAPSDFTVANAGERGRAIAAASTFPGALLHEIHINLKDPSVEEYWLHKAIFPDCSNMVMENLASGNTFFRFRHQGHDGPGPWSGVVSTTIT